VARTLAEEGAPEGTLVIADEQTAGRGRLERRWLAPPGTSLLFSLLLRPSLPVNRAQALTMVTGLALQAAVLELTGLPARLKWPNDIVVRGLKVGGILTEASSTGAHLEHAVVGIGLNVNLDAESFASSFRATSLSDELGHPIPRVPLLQAALWHIERRYVSMSEGAWPAADWAASLETIGQWIEVRTSQGQWRGRATGVDDDGALLLRTSDGQLKRVTVGDVVSRCEHDL
jgi:BirA family biotin operon repressor/biotin-[acetyl-CoA-carboxylase] ligase